MTIISEAAQILGRLGAQAANSRRTRAQRAEYGRRGGLATLRRHGRKHFRKMRKKSRRIEFYMDPENGARGWKELNNK